MKPQDTVLVCALAASHMEDTWTYITAFIGHDERADRGPCQDILFIFLTLTLPPSSYILPLHLHLQSDDMKLPPHSAAAFIKWPNKKEEK